VSMFFPTMNLTRDGSPVLLRNVGFQVVYVLDLTTLAGNTKECIGVHIWPVKTPIAAHFPLKRRLFQ
jgi:hypothetical protein